MSAVIHPCCLTIAGSDSAIHAVPSDFIAAQLDAVLGVYAIRALKTGCSLAAALASELALGHALPDAVAGAKAFVYRAIATSYLVGPDCGVLGWGT